MIDKEMEIEHAKCCACGKEKNGTKTQWWHLNGYYGLSGFVCSRCFEKVAHRDGKPNHPVAYRNILKKLTPSNAGIHRAVEGRPNQGKSHGNPNSPRF